jgi:AcrR family transcriptional regulator
MGAPGGNRRYRWGAMSTRLSAPARRAQLLETALTVFAEKGFHDTSMNDIAVAAGVTKPVLYQHFDSKRELYAELLEHVGNELLQSLVDATNEADGPRQQVERGYATFFRFVSENQNSYRLLFWGGNRRDDEFAQTLERVEAAIAGTVMSLITEDFDEGHRRTLSYGIVGLAEIVSRHWVADELTTPPEVLAEQLTQLAWSGLRGIRPSDS